MRVVKRVVRVRELPCNAAAAIKPMLLWLRNELIARLVDMCHQVQYVIASSHLAIKRGAKRQKLN
jgi:hypothetical protein